MLADYTQGRWHTHMHRTGRSKPPIIKAYTYVVVIKMVLQIEDYEIGWNQRSPSA